MCPVVDSLRYKINSTSKGGNTVLTKRDYPAMHPTRPIVSTSSISMCTIHLDRWLASERIGRISGQVRDSSPGAQQQDDGRPFSSKILLQALRE